ncbi:MAG: AAA family ATPase [Lachnospiraceae bacterium]|nr:AAA family ATPase [Lachnospiraceae bacterium]
MYRLVWDYYHSLAERCGRDAEGNELPFSLIPFYAGKEAEGGIEQNLNRLAKAFLGKEEELETVHRAGEAELEDLKRRVREICSAQTNDSQIDAVSQAILNDLTIIQGPPGTGKTETIKNIVLCIRRLRPAAKIAVISANREALSNAEDAVREDPDLSRRAARLGNQSMRKEFFEKLRAEDPQLHREMSHFFTRENRWVFPASLLEHYPIIFSTIHSLRNSVKADEYDYVLVDECSQVSCMLGMLAISQASHLILLGDDEQLPPIHKDTEDLCPEIIRNDAPWYLDEKDNSFMKAAAKSFDGRCGNILLNEHYRCHPAIIGFCNREIYGGQLRVMTHEDNRLPIRIRWYEGDYWEQTEDAQTETKRNCNLKQIEIFLKDELPGVIEKRREDPGYSICVLSPYRCELEVLHDRLEEVLAADDPVENTLEDIPEDVNDISQLTIHKAQGRGYDRVYILPVQDAGFSPWSQKRELINVAISRAKKELCVITSSVWMPRELQRESGVYVNPRENGRNTYLRSFLAYVREELEHRDPGTDYGFLRSSLRSIFDKVPKYRRMKHCADELRIPKINRSPSAPELCLIDELDHCDEIRNGYRYYREVPLSLIEGIDQRDEEIRRYIENGSRADFVIAREDRICAIIEVDGAYHRSDPETMENDALKDRAIRSLGEDFYRERFLRLTTDGSSENEMERILSVLNSDAPTVRLLAEEGELTEEQNEKDDLIDVLDRVMDEQIEGIRQIMSRPGSPEYREAFRVWSTIRYDREHEDGGRGPGAEDYSDPLFVSRYLMKYAYVYAFEYWVMYDALLHDFRGAEGNGELTYFGSACFGCGSCLDAWSLAYAAAKIRAEEENVLPENLELLYYGYDRARWGFRFDGIRGLTRMAVNPFDANGLAPGIEEVFADTDYEDSKWSRYNVLMFGKILNELPGRVLDEAIENIRIAAENGRFPRKEIYICISHNRSGGENNEELQEIASRVVGAINFDGSFEVNGRVIESSPLYQNGKIRCMNEAGDELHRIYAFADGRQYIWSLNPDFSGLREIQTLQNDDEFADEFTAGLRQADPRATFRLSTLTTAYISVQIIKLTKRD